MKILVLRAKSHIVKLSTHWANILHLSEVYLFFNAENNILGGISANNIKIKEDHSIVYQVPYTTLIMNSACELKEDGYRSPFCTPSKTFYDHSPSQSFCFITSLILDIAI